MHRDDVAPRQGPQVTGPDYLLHGPGERTPGERERDRKLVARLRYLDARRDYYRASLALSALTTAMVSLDQGDRDVPLRELRKAIEILETIDRPSLTCLPACQALENLLLADAAGLDGDGELEGMAAIVGEHFPEFVPGTLESLLAVGAVVCVEQCASADAGAWVAEAWGKKEPA